MYTQTESKISRIDREIDLPEYLSRLLKSCSARHDHLCPRQVLGVRMGLAGLAAIGVEAPVSRKTALVIIETDGCFADGIEVATGATIGHRTLRVKDMGKIAAVFANIETGRTIRLAPRRDVRVRAMTYAGDVKNKYYVQLKGYQIMPEAELFAFQEVLLKPPIQDILSRPGLRVICSHCGEEIINERQVLLDGISFCLTCAGENYYRLC